MLDKTYVWATLSEYQTAKSLQRRGFVALKYGGTCRTLFVTLTPAGKRLKKELGS